MPAATRVKAQPLVTAARGPAIGESPIRVDILAVLLTVSFHIGSSGAYCNADCQPAFGTFASQPQRVSPNARCGSLYGATGDYTCQGSGFGDCCSDQSYCGSSDAYCGMGCQSLFGNCASTSTSTTISQTSTTTSSSSSSSSWSSSPSSTSSSTSSSITPTATHITRTCSPKVRCFYPPQSLLLIMIIQDALGFPVGQGSTYQNLASHPVFYSFPAQPNEPAMDLYCTYSKSTGGLVTDQDAGFCPALAPLS